MLPKAFVALLLLGACVALKPLQELPTIGNTAAANDDQAAYWLDGNVIPSHYDLTLTTHIEKFDDQVPESFVFEGEVVIAITVKAEADNIVLHTNQINITSVELGDGSLKLEVGSYNETTHKQTLKTTDGKPLAAADYSLKIGYTGVHGDDMHGFYRSYYKNEKNENKWLVTTQFEAYDARRAFPCFDEPKYKATYNIIVKVSKALVDDQKYSALSNMPLKSAVSTDDGEYQSYVFDVTAKKISTYLIAFIVSDFVPTKTETFEDTKQFVTWGQKRFISTGEASMSQIAGPAALTTMMNLTGVPFGFPKVDQIGIPDFSAGAMENWGLITYRERLIFYNEKKNPTSQRQSVVTTTTHEVAHQWFGDIVTLWWWEDIWLNEGFATYFEYHATDKFDFASEWNIIGQMVATELQAGALASDALPNARALTKPVYRPGDIDANFDSVAYAKGGSVIRMWRHIMGDEKFYGALEDYLNAHAESNAHPEDLLAAFDKRASDDTNYKPSDDFKNWHLEAGYPVLNVSRDDTFLNLTQERFFVSAPESASTASWTIPITYTTADKPDFEIKRPQNFFKQGQKDLSIQLNGSAWTLINIQQTGYYRVNYDEAGWVGLTEQLIKDHKVIHEFNRAQILDDVFWLARSTYHNYAAYKTALDLSLYLEKEESLIPWTAALNSFSYLYGKLSTDEVGGPLLKAHITKLIAPQFSRLKLEVKDSDSHTDKLLRNQISAWACKLEIQECVDAALELTLQSDNTHPDVKSTVTCTNVREGSPDNWDIVWKTYQNTTDNAEQTLLMSSLGCSKDAETIKKFLDITIDGSGSIRKQDLTSAFTAAYSGNPGNVQLALDFVEKHYTDIAKIYGGMDPLGGVMIGLAGKLGSDEELARFKKINDLIQQSTDDDVKKGQVGSTAAVDVISSNNNWLKEKQTAINSWLQENSTGGAPGMSATVTALLLPALMAFVLGQ